MSNAAPATGAQLWRTPLTYMANPTDEVYGSYASQGGSIDQPGSLREDVDPSLGRRTFVFCLLANSPNVTIGQAVCFDNPANVSNIAANLVPQGIRISNTSTVTANLAQTVGANTTGTQQDLVRGVAIVNVTVNKFAWFQTSGPHANVVVTGAVAAGDQIIHSTTNGTAVALTANVTAGSGAAVQPVGRAIGANAGTVAPVFLNLPQF